MSSFSQHKPKLLEQINSIRQQFPALNTQDSESLPIFFDGPGGTQIPTSVIAAVGDYYRQGNSNLGGDFSVSRKTVDIVNTARDCVATLVGATSPSTIVFGANMTSLTLSFSRSIGQTWQAGDNIILSEADHGGNRSAWKRIAEERGVHVHYIPIIDKKCALDLKYFDTLINNKTRLVAVTAASNVSGTRTDLEHIIKAAKENGAISYIDAVHLLPHQRLNVTELDCDFLAGSVYKFFGPHVGFVYGKKQHLEGFKPYKVEPAPTFPPNCWETGTLNFEALAGTVAAIHYMASLGEGDSLDEQLDDAYQNIIRYEHHLAKMCLDKLIAMPEVTIYGVHNDSYHERTPTFALSFANHQPKEIAQALGEKNIFTWSGHLYADKLIDSLGLSDKGGILRIGLTHYNTEAEVDLFIETLESILNS
ncbi:cysteine desulfurase-like protein [Marinomonas sp. C2222]|uniref:Cysteine desulfurase-like protein n=1 Tax=Marinomonas sargassi TaxID=2984494 RepID=A0ABT2YRK2_9GAMM|nr:cysteine desulfurase-like protein [Marinomonas sargassi]MCV2402513.1 cysteine desulfurase-like protein [Marinomonas sargassi]